MSNPIQGKTPPDPGGPPPKLPPPRRNASPWWMLLVLGAVLAVVYFARNNEPRSKITYGQFRQELDKGNIEKVELQGAQVLGEFVQPPPDPEGKKDAAGNLPTLEKKFTTTLSPLAGRPDGLDDAIFRKLGGRYTATEPGDN
ncbi:MAG: ATP-dependent metallopeptidase FtsH/Yme1/Tma family protein, partial [Thermoguttaceae bacterium]